MTASEARKSSIEQMRLKVWDRPTRLFHWLLVVLIAAAWWTAENEALTWHYRIGMLVLALLVFRLIWGFAGGSTARFANFVRGPRAILDYLRGRSPVAAGHNPLGALSVLAILGLVAVLVALGLFASDDDGIEPGPLAYLVSVDQADAAQEWHEALFVPLLALIALHVAAILYYWIFRGDNLVAPMLTGARDASPRTEPMQSAPAWRFVVALLAATAFTLWIWSGASTF